MEASQSESGTSDHESLRARSVLLLDRPKVTRLYVRNSTIEFRHITADGPLVRRERLGGLLNYYYREAA